MKNESFYQQAIPLTAVVAMMWLAMGCSPKADDHSPASSVTVSNVTLTAEQRQHIQIDTIAPTNYCRSVEASGVVDFDNDQATSVLAPFGGPVTRLLVSPGDQVKAGDALAEVASPDFATAVSAYRKALATAQTDRQLADLDKDLIEHHGVSQREEAQAQTDAANAEADRDAARQALVALNIDPQIIKDVEDGKPVTNITGVIRSPIAGTVVEKLILPGQLLQAGTTPCFTVADLSRVWVNAQLFGADLDPVKVGDPVEVATGIGTNTISGTVDNIATEVDATTRSVMVRVVVNNPDGVLKRQMYVSVRIQSRQERTGLLAPVSAILRDDENLPFVYVVQPDGSYARQPVTLGGRVGEQYEIPTGLNGGGQIVVDGAIFVQFMQNQ